MKRQLKQMLALIIVASLAIMYMPMNVSAETIKAFSKNLVTFTASSGNASSGNASSGNASSGNATSGNPSDKDEADNEAGNATSGNPSDKDEADNEAGNATSGNATSGNPSDKDDATTDDPTDKDDPTTDPSDKDDATTDDPTDKDDPTTYPSDKDDPTTDDPSDKDDPTTDPSDKDETDKEDSVADQIKDSNDKRVEINNTEAVKLDKDVFESMKKGEKNLVYSVVGKDNKFDYSWTFASGNFKDTNVSVDLKLDKADKNDKVEKHLKDDDALYLNFAHHGKLPGNATITVSVDDKFKEGTKVYLYYYDEEADKVLKVGKNALTIKSGCVEFTITHCSTYFLTEEELAVELDQNSAENVEYNVATGDNFNMNILIYLLVACFASLAAFVIASSKGVKAVRE